MLPCHMLLGVVYEVVCFSVAEMLSNSWHEMDLATIMWMDHAL